MSLLLAAGRSALLLSVFVLALTACDASNTFPDRSESTPLAGLSQARIVLTSTGQAAQSRTVSLGSPGTAPDTLRFVSPAAVPARTYAGTFTLELPQAHAQFLAEAESRLVVYSGGPLDLRVTDRESFYTVTNLNTGDYAVGRSFSITVPPGQLASGTLRVQMTRFEGAAKPNGSTPGPISEFEFTIPFVVRP